MNTTPASRRLAQQRYMLARAWHSKGRISKAITSYQEVLAVDPAHPQSPVHLGALLQSQLRLDEALDVYEEALRHNSNESRIHKQLTNILFTQDGAEAAFRRYRLIRADARQVSLRPSDVVCCFVLRDEIARLPYFLDYYRARGIAAFFAVDNGSSDGSREFLLAQSDVYLWESDYSFNQANFGASWFELILRMHARNHWCVMVDADELLYYPDCERRSIPDLCRSLDRGGRRAYNAVHLDMYSDLPIRSTHYIPGTPFEETCRYFDRQFFHRRDENAAPFHNQQAFYGGVRHRVFGGSGFYLSKVPLLKYDVDCILAGGQHWTNLSEELISPGRGALLHFKYFSHFPDRASEEAIRKEHYGGAILYQEYDRGMREQPELCFHDPELSVRLEDSRQLVRLGIMEHDEGEEHASGGMFPHIGRPSVEAAPFWSVMISVYRRTTWLEQALRSVLAQAPASEQMQIEVVVDRSDDTIHSQIESSVRSLAGDRIQIYFHPVNAGQPEIFNVCVRRARGLWVHILHDDDSIEPGFYEALKRGIDQDPEVGAAFCRHTHVDELGQPETLSLLERETPGTIERWLDRIGVCCRLQTPAIVVRREAYERLGGYCPQAKSAFDWEMWQRLAVHYKFWYDPRPLANFRHSRDSESSRLASCGRQVADALAAVEVARSYMPKDKAEVLAGRAAEYYAIWAFDVAAQQIRNGDPAAAIENIREGIRCSRSQEAMGKLVSVLLQVEQLQS